MERFGRSEIVGTQSTDHHAELADVRKADGAVRLFSNIIRPSGFQKPSAVSSGENMESLAADLGCLFGDAVRTGTGMVAVTLTAVAQALTATLLRVSAEPSNSMSSAEASVPEEPSKPQLSVLNPDEIRLRNIFTRFMPMLISSVRHGGTGDELAEKVITMPAGCFSGAYRRI